MYSYKTEIQECSEEGDGEGLKWRRCVVMENRVYDCVFVEQELNGMMRKRGESDISMRVRRKESMDIEKGWMR